MLPFIQMLGYDIFDPTEVVPEFTADIGIKRGEKVDYAIMQRGKPAILIECKKYGSNLAEDAVSQLVRYFGVTNAHFGILTDGSSSATSVTNAHFGILTDGSATGSSLTLTNPTSWTQSHSSSSTCSVAPTKQSKN